MKNEEKNKCYVPDITVKIGELMEVSPDQKVALDFSMQVPVVYI